MNGLIEIVFESVPDEKLNELVEDIFGSNNIIELTHSELGKHHAVNNHGNYLRLLKATAEPASIFIRTVGISFGNVLIRRPLVRVLRCDQSNDLSISFDSSDVAEADKRKAVGALNAEAKALALKHGIKSFYGGFEPATDEVTRLFTGDKIGPLTAL